MLDYYGVAYDVIEVETLKRTQLKWSSYRKVPLLVMEGVGPDGYTVTLCTLCIFTVYIHWVFTMYSLCIYCIFTVYLLCIYCL